jgi:hypothetical protein
MSKIVIEEFGQANQVLKKPLMKLTPLYRFPPTR